MTTPTDTQSAWLASPFGRIATAPAKPSGKPIPAFQHNTDANGMHQMTLADDGELACLQAIVEKDEASVSSQAMVYLINARLVDHACERAPFYLTETGQQRLDALRAADPTASRAQTAAQMTYRSHGELACLRAISDGNAHDIRPGFLIYMRHMGLVDRDNHLTEQGRTIMAELLTGTLVQGRPAISIDEAARRSDTTLTNAWNYVRSGRWQSIMHKSRRLIFADQPLRDQEAS